MGDGSSLINLGDISKPATVLIEKISDAIGGYCKPFQMRRIAQAESDVEIIKLKSQLELEDLQKRAINRFLNEESRKQENMEEITQKALPCIGDNAKPEDIQDDWLINFFDKCRNISDTDMQSIWSKILSGEANSPGSFSKRCVNFVESLDAQEALQFTSLCSFKWDFGIKVPLVINDKDSIYRDNGLNFSILTRLDTIGLIKFNSFSPFRSRGLGKSIKGSYFGKWIILDFEKEIDNEFNLGTVIFSQIGEELSTISEAKIIPNFFEYCTAKWKEDNITVRVL